MSRRDRSCVVVVGVEDEYGCWHYRVSAPMSEVSADRAVQAWHREPHPGAVAFWRRVGHRDVESYRARA